MTKEEMVQKIEEENKRINEKYPQGTWPNTWDFLVGFSLSSSNPKKLLTQIELDNWAWDKERKTHCIHCNWHIPGVAGYCPVCREYKGIQPCVVGHCDCGES